VLAFDSEDLFGISNRHTEGAAAIVPDSLGLLRDNGSVDIYSRVRGVPSNGCEIFAF
jgi:hypothetical protein